MIWSTRTAVFAVCFALAAALAAQGLFAASVRPGKERPKLALDAVPLVTNSLSQIPRRAERQSSTSVHVIFVGDSMLLAHPTEIALPDRVERTINQGAPRVARVKIHPVVVPGSGSFDYYFVADAVSSREPDLVVVEFNLTTLSETWRVAFARPELAGLISPHRIPEAATLPLHWTGLTADRMLGYVALVRMGATELWMKLARRQARVSNLPHRLSRWVAGLAGTSAEERFLGLRFLRNVRHQSHPESGRFDGEAERERFGAALSGVTTAHPVLRALAATLASFGREGIPVLVYVNPANVQNLEATGVLDRKLLGVTLSSIEHVVKSAGGRYADLHDLLPDAGFSDPAGHLSHGGEVDGTLTVAQAIAEVVSEEAARVRARRRRASF